MGEEAPSFGEREWGKSLAKLPPSCPSHMKEGPPPSLSSKQSIPVFLRISYMGPCPGNLGGNSPECDDDVIPADIIIILGNATRPKGLQPLHQSKGKVPVRPKS